MANKSSKRIAMDTAAMEAFVEVVVTFAKELEDHASAIQKSAAWFYDESNIAGKSTEEVVSGIRRSVEAVNATNDKVKQLQNVATKVREAFGLVNRTSVKSFTEAKAVLDKSVAAIQATEA